MGLWLGILVCGKDGLVGLQEVGLWEDEGWKSGKDDYPPGGQSLALIPNWHSPGSSIEK